MYVTYDTPRCLRTIENTMDWGLLVLFIGGSLLLMVLELNIPMAEPGEIRDIGHDLFKSFSKPLGGKFATFLNSLLLCGCVIYAAIDVILSDAMTVLLRHLVILFWLRFLVGVSTRLPAPGDFLPLSCDIPPAGCNFFYLFSCHTATITTVALHVTGKHGGWWWLLFISILLFQTMRLLATRGHYTADIIIALALSIFIYA